MFIANLEILRDKALKTGNNDYLNFLPSFDEAHRVIESCLFWNIPIPQDKLVSKTTFSPILKLGGSKERAPFALRSLLNKIKMTHVKNCPAELQRRKSIGILPAFCRYPKQKQLFEYNRTLRSLSLRTYRQVDGQFYEYTQSRPLFMLEIGNHLFPPTFICLHTAMNAVSDNHFRYHVFRSCGDPTDPDTTNRVNSVRVIESL